MTDLATVSRTEQRRITMLQHPIFLYQVSRPVCNDDGEQVATEWVTKLVFATGSEAHAYGQGNVHNDGEPGEGWRVYSVPCGGTLAALLEKAMAP